MLALFTKTRCLFVLALFSWAGCTTQGPTGPIYSPDAGNGVEPPSPDPLTLGEPLPAARIPIGTATSAAALPGGFLIDGPRGTQWVTGSTEAAASERLGALYASAQAGGEAVVASARGLFVARATEISASGLGAAFGGDAIESIATGQSDGLFARSASALYAYAGGNGRAIHVPGLDARGAVIAYGGPLLGQAALWVGSSSGIYGLLIGGEDVRAYPERTEGSPRAIAVDAAGTVWAIAADHLLRRLPEGRWIEEPALMRPSGLALSPDRRQVWIANSDGIWHHRSGVLHRVDPAPADAIVADDRGLMARSGDQLRLIVPGQAIAVFDLSEGEQLRAARAIVIDAGGAAVSLTLDGASVSGAPFRTGQRLNLGPGLTPAGDHVLAANAGADTVSLHFSVLSPETPTWSRDIGPIYDSHCQSCHNPAGNGHNLSTAELWQEDVDRILAAVRERRMPLPPNPALPASAIDQIAAWKAAHFPN